jgi:hypothetical protein
MLWKIDELKRWIQNSAAMHKQLAAKVGEREGLLPRWLELQGACEEIASRIEAVERTYRRAVDDPLWRARSAALDAELEDACRRRDELLDGINGEIHELRETLFKQNSVLIGQFGNWIQRVGVPEDHQAKLRAALAQAEAMYYEPVGKILDFIAPYVEEIEAMEDIDRPAFRIKDFARQALGESVPESPRKVEQHPPAAQAFGEFG